MVFRSQSIKLNTKQLSCILIYFSLLRKEQCHTNCNKNLLVITFPWFATFGNFKLSKTASKIYKLYYGGLWHDPPSLKGGLRPAEGR